MCAIDLRPAEERERLKSSLREWLRLERKRLPSDLSSPSGVELVRAGVEELGPLAGYLGAVLLVSQFDLEKSFEEMKAYAGYASGGYEPDEELWPRTDELFRSLSEESGAQRLFGTSSKKLDPRGHEGLPEYFVEELFEYAEFAEGKEFSVYDPTSGYGSFPLNAMAFWLANEHGLAGRESSLTLQDTDESKLQLAAFLCACYSIKTELRCFDALESPPLTLSESGDDQLRKFDRVLLDPPWGHEIGVRARRALKSDDFGRFQLVDSEAVSSEYLFLVHALSCCDPRGGRVAALLPQKLLSSSGRGGADRSARQMIAKFSPVPLRAVISLPPLYHSTNARPALLLFDAERSYSPEEDKVLFVRGEKWFTRGGKAHGFGPEEVLSGRGVADSEGLCMSVERSALEGKSSSWEPRDYVVRRWVFGSGAGEARREYLKQKKVLRESSERVDDALRHLKEQTRVVVKGRSSKREEGDQ